MTNSDDDLFSEKSTSSDTQQVQNILELEAKIPDILSSAGKCIEAIQLNNSLEDFRKYSKEFLETVEFISTGLRRQALELEKAEVPVVSLQPKKRYASTPLSNLIFDQSSKLM
uniref:Mediator of RNA polymerase II transcription subunit 11 n=1 Tax=Schizosaccharomyces pombe (strain 972 / ATCC 24843) TaxID=284812 RepID=MED11_SCHPO|nr:RecName: Full=Mediator of RNA polymerase II transcription subunit 11; AltName: Full=Mediator complex subunit 11 [Schizosaccharomyces pombe 972h-]4H63_K Chain K, Mediator of RNA polymerase II transcription subunit 11 [Schizosaccharomyces pombe 972h-]5N9J_V Chain V, Mediator of RNA polymerase II transcription subunit 11 [Schizosaccharomyces pombe]